MTCVRCGCPKKYHPGGAKGICMRCSKCFGFVQTGPVFIGWQDDVALYNYRAPGAPDGQVNTWGPQKLRELGIVFPEPPKVQKEES